MLTVLNISVSGSEEDTSADCSGGSDELDGTLLSIEEVTEEDCSDLFDCSVVDTTGGSDEVDSAVEDFEDPLDELVEEDCVLLDDDLGLLDEDDFGLPDELISIPEKIEEIFGVDETIEAEFVCPLYVEDETGRSSLSVVNDVSPE